MKEIDKILIKILLVYSFLLKLVNSLASPIFKEICFQADNDVFYTVAKSMIRGKVLYRDLIDNKGPYTYFINVIANFLPYRHVGLYIIESFLLFITLLFVYKIIKLYIVNSLYAFSGTCIFSLLLCASCFTLGMSKTECYTMGFNLMLVYYLYHLIKCKRKSNDKDYIILGCVFGVIYLVNLKHAATAFISLLFIALYNTLNAFMLNKNLLHLIINLMKIIILYLFGLIISFIPFILYVIITESFNEALYCLMILPFKYVGEGTSLFYSSSGIVDSILHHIIYFKYFFIFIIISLIIVILYEKNLILKSFYILSLFITIFYTAINDSPYRYYLVAYFPFLLPLIIMIFKYMDMVFVNIIKKSIHGNLLNIHVLGIVVISFVISLNLGYKDISRQYPAYLHIKKLLNESVKKYDENTKNLKILGVGFIPEVYSALDNTIQFPCFITMNNTYKGAKEFVDAQCGYIEDGIAIYIFVNTRDSFLSFSDKMKKRTELALKKNYNLVEEITTRTTNGDYTLYKRK